MPITVSRKILAALLPFILCAAASPSDSLLEQLTAMKDTKTLHADFICEKKLALLETPLLSRGELWIQKGDPKDGDGAVRFSTEKPYLSELILAKGKVLAKSQHESEWTKTNQSGRPGLTAVMGQLGAWSTGDQAKLTEQYDIAASADAVPEIPASAPAATKPANPETKMFTLTPTNKDLLKAVKHVTVGIDAANHHLRYIEILTQQDDATRYWFYDVKVNPDLPADIFSPSAAPAATAPSSNKP